MDAILLAAGLGTRLRPHTLTTPKPLLPVQGRPILEWLLCALPSVVDRVVVVVNHLAEQIEAFLKQQQHIRDWTAVRQQQPKGTGNALRCCRGHVHSDRFLVLNGDDLYGTDDLLRLTEKPAGLLVHPVDEPSKFGIVFTRPDGTVEKLVEKPKLEGRQMANIGAYLFPRRALDIDLPLSPRGEYEITDAVSAIAATQPFFAVPAKFWLPIGTVEAWEAAQGVDLRAAEST
ncbi:MAG TPA: nucleotidyltransferase family protein [Gemmataceae bacterium]|jgi:bifunctional UDP-N-acetylglucosamine pyrophosphorylase/glucosamine-1-phosphate N-acetyltransferase|nr:nucleotidyltransferase family protein [Gemmataceae bacterium]